MIWLLLFTSFHGFTQSSETSAPGSAEYIGITGSPYFMKDWADGIIRFSSGKVTDKFKLRFNVVQNRLMLQFQGSSFAAESKITEFVMYGRNKKDSFVFRKGFPDTERGSKETFYRVLAEGKVILLLLTAKDIVEEKDILAPKPSRHFQDTEQFYLFKNGSMHKVDRDTAPIQDILSEHRDALKSYISENQLKMRSADDLVKVTRKYNELQQ